MVLKDIYDRPSRRKEEDQSLLVLVGEIPLIMDGYLLEMKCVPFFIIKQEEEPDVAHACAPHKRAVHHTYSIKTPVFFFNFSNHIT